MKTIGIAILLLTLMTGEQVEDIGAEYRFEIIDEHEVIFMNQSDTITVRLENAYALAKQNNIAFIK